MLLPGVGEKKPVLQYARVLFFKKACPEEKLVTQSLPVPAFSIAILST